MKIKILTHHFGHITLEISDHAKDRMKTRNITKNEIIEVLQNKGHYLKNKRAIRIRYTYVGRTYAGRELKMSIERIKSLHYKLITVIDPNI